jgi:uncharacterized damage-inducible protein DinB
VAAMTSITGTSIKRVDPPLAASETETLLGYLNYHRQTLRMKTEGLDQEQLARALAPSTLTLGGLLKHMALVEDNWFSVVLLGNAQAEPWASADWDADRDWEFHTARDDSPEELHRLFDETVAASDQTLREVIAEDGLDRLSVRESKRHGGKFSLRWIIVHMIEEYARHNGHADLIRESIDGQTGE